MKPTTVNFPDRVDRALQDLALQTGRSCEELICEAVDRYLIDAVEIEGDRDSSNIQSLLELFDEVTADMTEEDIQKLPTDGAVNHDFYLYESPKTET